MLPVIPESVKLRRRGSCVPTVIACLPHLKHGRDFVIEGWVSFGDRGWEHQHTWMLVDGIIFDPSLVQFEHLQTFSKPLHRRQGWINTVREYRSNCADLSRWWIERCLSFGVTPSALPNLRVIGGPSR